jgi:heme oxygenase (biliverdin-IX-beta and delta-forming)
MYARFSLATTMLDVLRSETRALHEQVEANPRLNRIMQEGYTRDEYRVLLMRLYGFYAPLEDLVAEVLPDAPFRLTERRKAPLLRHDLIALGLIRSDVDHLPLCGDVPEVATLPQALGCLYVMEGATLGGKIMSRQLRRSLVLGVDSGAAFYSSYGDRIGEMWRALCHAINAVPLDDFSRCALVTAARETFEKLDSWLSTT